MNNIHAPLPIIIIIIIIIIWNPMQLGFSDLQEGKI
jgi:hypothetical protein